MLEWFYLLVVVLFGLIIGSFLNVVIYRLHTGRSLNDRSHCLSCGHTLKWYELFPVLSYLALRGRCRACRSFIPYRYALVEILTAGLFCLAYLHLSDIVSLFLLFAFLSVLVVVLVYDLYHMIIPDETSLILASLALSVVGYQSWMVGDINLLATSLLSAFLAFIFFASLWFFSGGRWLGFGDAKLAVGLAMLVGLGGAFSLIVWSFWVGAVVSLVIIAWQYIGLHKSLRRPGRSGVTMKSEIPFAPFLIASFILVYFGEVNVLDLVELLLSYVM